MQNIADLRDEAEWMDMSFGGSNYEVQLNQRTGQYRHRTRTAPPSFNGSGEEHTIETPWTMGPPKEGFGNG